jgi:fumarylpyruvate hydrolase
MARLFETVAVPEAPVTGGGDTFPIRRIHCVGRNYAEHVREMGGDPKTVFPCLFTKFADTYAPGGSQIAYPPRTANYHYEVELVVAIGADGADVAADAAKDLIFGYAVGLDMTRRDRQREMKDKGWPWDIGKNFDQAMPMGPISPAAAVGHPREGAIWLDVNGERRQAADLTAMIWSVDEIVATVSSYVRLAPGDLIMTGTPSGVGPVVRGDRLVGGVAGLEPVDVTIV